LDELKDTSYPKILILMLLSDWVFTQQPHTIKRLIAHLVNQPGLKILLANVSRDRASVALLPPERCGRDDLLTAIEKWFNSGVDADVCSVLATSVRDGLAKDSAANFWTALVPAAGQEDSWFLFGRLVGAFSRLTHADARSFFTKYGDGFLRHLCAAERHDIIEADPEMFELAAKTAIRTSGSSLPFLYSPGRDLSFLGSFGITLDLSIYTILFDRDWGEAILAAQPYRSILRVARSIPDSFNPIAPAFESATIESCKRFVSRFEETIDLPSSEWAQSLKPWSAIVQAGIKEWGISPAFIDMALIAAGIASKEERGKFGMDFQDEAVSICETLRFARLKSGAPQWWSSQLEFMKSNFHLALTTLLCWATVRTILQLAPQIEPMIDSLSEVDWFNLVERIKRIARIGASSNASSAEVATVASDRLFLALALRLARADSDLVIFSRSKNYKGEDAKLLEACRDSALRIAPESPSAWNQAIHLTELAYSAKVGTGQILRRARPELNIPESIAKKVCGSAGRFPLALVYFAQSSLQSTRASEIGKPLGELARKDRWFHGY
jgi:hypothetical protein